MTRFLRCSRLLSVLVVAAAAPACSHDDTCGNGQLDRGEVCDGTDLRSTTCQQLGYATGTLGCTDRCQFDVSGCEGLVDCGNGVIDPGEQCDGDDLAGATCANQHLGGGTLACDPYTCQFDLTGCEGRGICGDGVADGDEECDGDDLRDATCATADATFVGGTLYCSASCHLVTSGCYGAPAWPLGQACQTTADCPGGECFPERNDYGFGPPAGMCWEECAADGSCPLTGDAGICISVYGMMRRCFLRCDPAAASPCRPGYGCRVTADGAYCYPACHDDSDCPDTGLCDSTTGSYTSGLCAIPEEYCYGGEDEDGDGLVDCADPDCTGQPPCPTGEICGNGLDDDDDGYTDCDDAECGVLGICTGQLCSPVPGADLTCGTSLTQESNDASGYTTAVLGASCTDPAGHDGPALSGSTGPEYTYTLTVATPQVVTLALSGVSGDLDVYVLTPAPGGECDPYQHCFAYGAGGMDEPETVTFAAYPGQPYYVVVDGSAGSVSDYDLQVTCDATGYEVCDNGLDDDGDGLTDCDDPECAVVPAQCP